jgi:hypothetical protein
MHMSTAQGGGGEAIRGAAVKRAIITEWRLNGQQVWAVLIARNPANPAA